MGNENVGGEALEKVVNTLKELISINEKYGLNAAGIHTFLDGYDRELLCVPIIGEFSSGKSAAVNTLLGYGRKILVEDIIPETAVPTEIQYPFDPKSKDTVRILYDNGEDNVYFLKQYIDCGSGTAMTGGGITLSDNVSMTPAPRHCGHRAAISFTDGVRLRDKPAMTRCGVKAQKEF